VYSCSHWLRPRNTLPPPAFGLIFERALLVSQERRHLFVTPSLDSLLNYSVLYTLIHTQLYNTHPPQQDLPDSVPWAASFSLKEPKHEIFGADFFAHSKPVLLGDLGVDKKIRNIYGLGLIFIISLVKLFISVLSKYANTEFLLWDREKNVIGCLASTSNLH
jgi:hypothetical protein